MITSTKKHKVTQTKKKRAFEHLAFLENEHSSKTVLLLRAPRKFVREHSSNGLTLRAFRKLEGSFATPQKVTVGYKWSDILQTDLCSLRDSGATLGLGGGHISDSILEGGGGTRHFFLLTF